jgi:hypothetical protein
VTADFHVTSCKESRNSFYTDCRWPDDAGLRLDLQSTALILSPKKLRDRLEKNMGQLSDNMGFMGLCERQMCLISDNHIACNIT